MSALERIRQKLLDRVGPAVVLFYHHEDGYYYAVGDDRDTLVGYVGAGHVHRTGVSLVRERLILVHEKSFD